MNPPDGKRLITKMLDKGWIRRGNKVYTPTQAKALNLSAEVRKRGKKLKRTGDQSDERNIRNKAKHADQFTRLIEIELQCEIWPEYYFTTERQYRLDYAFPEYKIAIEVQGGIWAKGNSGHTSGKGISRDMAKLNLLTANGWVLIQVTPSQLITSDTIDLIRKAIDNKH